MSCLKMPQTKTTKKMYTKKSLITAQLITITLNQENSHYSRKRNLYTTSEKTKSLLHKITIRSLPLIVISLIRVIRNFFSYNSIFFPVHIMNKTQQRKCMPYCCCLYNNIYVLVSFSQQRKSSMTEELYFSLLDKDNCI
jgi:hypothetical protein